MPAYALYRSISFIRCADPPGAGGYCGGAGGAAGGPAAPDLPPAAQGAGDIADVDGFLIHARAADALEGIGDRHIPLQIHELRGHEVFF